MRWIFKRWLAQQELMISHISRGKLWSSSIRQRCGFGTTTVCRSPPCVIHTDVNSCKPNPIYAGGYAIGCDQLCLVECGTTKYQDPQILQDQIPVTHYARLIMHGVHLDKTTATTKH